MTDNIIQIENKDGFLVDAKLIPVSRGGMVDEDDTDLLIEWDDNHIIIRDFKDILK